MLPYSKGGEQHMIGKQQRRILDALDAGAHIRVTVGAAYSRSGQAHSLRTERQSRLIHPDGKDEILRDDTVSRMADRGFFDKEFPDTGLSRPAVVTLRRAL